MLKRKDGKALAARAMAAIKRFEDCRIPVIPIVTEDLETATTGFQRINTWGTSMSVVHMVSALSWSPGFDLNERLSRVQDRLAEVGWQKLDTKMILAVCKAGMGLDIYKAGAEATRDALKQEPEVIDLATDNLIAAARFLAEDCDVLGPSILPYSYQVVLLAHARFLDVRAIYITSLDASFVKPLGLLYERV